MTRHARRKRFPSSSCRSNARLAVPVERMGVQSIQSSPSVSPPGFWMPDSLPIVRVSPASGIWHLTIFYRRGLEASTDEACKAGKTREMYQLMSTLKPFRIDLLYWFRKTQANDCDSRNFVGVATEVFDAMMLAAKSLAHPGYDANEPFTIDSSVLPRLFKEYE
jgi:hypothetical protein